MHQRLQCKRRKKKRKKSKEEEKKKEEDEKKKTVFWIFVVRRVCNSFDSCIGAPVVELRAGPRLSAPLVDNIRYFQLK